MITIVYNNSDITLYRIPIRGNQTLIFSLHHRSDPQALQTVIDYFNHTTVPTNQTSLSHVASTIFQWTDQCHTPNILLMIGSLIILFLFLFLLFIFLIYIKRHRCCPSNQRYQSAVCVIDDKNHKLNNHETHFNVVDIGDDYNDPTDYDVSGKEKTRVGDRNAF
jgi:hypothetical protein